jgi:hypothetical protein
MTKFSSDFFRQRVREKFHGLSYLFEIINQIMISKSEPVASADLGLLDNRFLQTFVLN